MENDNCLTEIVSGFGEPGGAPTPRIPRTDYSLSKTAVEKKWSQKRNQFAFNKLHVNEDNAQLE